MFTHVFKSSSPHHWVLDVKPHNKNCVLKYSKRATPFLIRGNSGCLYDFITNHTLFCFSVINKTGQSKMVSSNKWLFQLNIFPYNPQSGIKMSKMALKDESNVAESCSMHHMSNYNCLDMLKFHTE